MIKTAKIEEFTYECGKPYKLYRVKIITTKKFFSIFKYKTEFVIPFVFMNESTAKDFLQYDIDYTPITYKGHIYESYTEKSAVYLDACEIVIKTLNNVKMLVTFWPHNTYVEHKRVVNDSKLGYEHIVKFDSNIKIFRDLILDDNKNSTPRSIESCKSIIGKNTYEIVPSIINFKGPSCSYSSISDFAQSKSWFPEYFSNTNEDGTKFNIDSNITNVKEFVLQEV